jgi:hypothetical protein
VSPDIQYAEQKKRDPLGPLLGFIILIVGGAFSWIVAPGVIDWMENTHFVFGFLGPVLPIHYPDNWPSLIQRLVTGGFMFLVFFVIAMVVIMAMAGSSHQGELDVSIKEVRERKADRTPGGKKKKRRFR